jgi:flagellar biosynthesis GTPase FlhF
MEEKQKQEEAVQANAPETEKKEPETVTIRKGELAGYKTQLKQLAKELEEFKGQKAAEEAAKLKAAADWEALEKKSRSELEAIKNELAATRRSALSERARSALLEAGMSAGLIVDGALSKLPPDLDVEGIPAWLEEVRTAHPEAFVRPSNPIGAPSAGPVVKATESEKARLKANVAAMRGKGPDKMAAAIREAREYEQRTGIKVLE